jgi:hypothetical protein
VFHPEVDGPLGEALADFAKMELVDVWCTGCNGFVKMNSNFAKYLNGEIGSCSKCRNLKLAR